MQQRLTPAFTYATNVGGTLLGDGTTDKVYTGSGLQDSIEHGSCLCIIAQFSKHKCLNFLAVSGRVHGLL